MDRSELFGGMMSIIKRPKMRIALSLGAASLIGTGILLGTAAFAEGGPPAPTPLEVRTIATGQAGVGPYWKVIVGAGLNPSDATETCVVAIQPSSQETAGGTGICAETWKPHAVPSVSYANLTASALEPGGGSGRLLVIALGDEGKKVDLVAASGEVLRMEDQTDAKTTKVTVNGVTLDVLVATIDGHAPVDREDQAKEAPPALVPTYRES